ncbi:MAG: FAD-binding protein [Bacteroidia bacterium]|nr:FAD-binding protein [Bacteroidia bacterium]MDW8348359.1 FAD-linked oxidase C-terminal domain-containing protein [Bacteroidia bacterium]
MNGQDTLPYQKVYQEDVEYFEKIVSAKNILLPQQEKYENYLSDHTEDYVFYPEIVLKPHSAEQISQILSYCNEKHIPVTPRGAGTGLSGGSLCVCGGVCLSVENLNRIIEIDTLNFQAVVEPGVITQVFQEAVIEKGLFYPPDPSSRGSCFMGGNIAHNSGGPRAVKYGVVKDYILGLEVVLANGSIIQTGAKTLKNATGYNLTALIIGSEGTLGVVTKIFVKLIPYPKFRLCMLVPFYEEIAACNAVASIFRINITPSALEFMEYDAITWGQKYTGIQLFDDPHIRAHLLIEVDGNELESLYQDCEKIYKVLEAYPIGEVLFADSTDAQANLWKLRRSIGEAVKQNSIYKEEDTVVPRAHLGKLLQGVKEIGKRYGFRSICYGHAGDGNLHVNIVKENMPDKMWKETIPQAIREIFHLCKQLGGTISGEHGVGYVQRPYLDIVFDPVQIDIMKQIKKIFDPNGILNPQKIFV